MKQEMKELTPKGQRSYQRIIAIAIDLFRTRGYNETTIKDICAGVDIGTGTFYHYFRSKTDVIMGYVGFEEEELTEFYRQQDRTSYSRLILAVADHYLDKYLFKGADLIAHVYSMLLLSEINIGKLNEEVLHRIFADCCLQGQKNGEFSSDISPAAFSDILLAQWFFFTSLWCNDPDSIDLRQVIVDQFKVVLNLVSTKK